MRAKSVEYITMEENNMIKSKEENILLNLIKSSIKELIE